MEELQKENEEINEFTNPKHLILIINDRDEQIWELKKEKEDEEKIVVNQAKFKEYLDKEIKELKDNLRIFEGTKDAHWNDWLNEEFGDELWPLDPPEPDEFVEKVLELKKEKENLNKEIVKLKEEKDEWIEESLDMRKEIGVMIDKLGYIVFDADGWEKDIIDKIAPKLIENLNKDNDDLKEFAKKESVRADKNADICFTVKELSAILQEDRNKAIEENKFLKAKGCCDANIEIIAERDKENDKLCIEIKELNKQIEDYEESLDELEDMVHENKTLKEKKINEFQKQNDKLKSKNTILSKAIRRLINEKKELEEQLKIK